MALPLELGYAWRRQLSLKKGQFPEGAESWQFPELPTTEVDQAGNTA